MRSFQLGDVSDEDLLRQLQSGATDALSLLFDRHCRLVFSVVHRVLRDSREAEDLMQEVFLNVYRDARNFDPARGSVKSWILEYATGLSLDRCKFVKLTEHSGERAVSGMLGK